MPLLGKTRLMNALASHKDLLFPLRAATCNHALATAGSPYGIARTNEAVAFLRRAPRRPTPGSQFGRRVRGARKLFRQTAFFLMLRSSAEPIPPGLLPGPGPARLRRLPFAPLPGSPPRLSSGFEHQPPQRRFPPSNSRAALAEPGAGLCRSSFSGGAGFFRTTASLAVFAAAGRPATGPSNAPGPPGSRAGRPGAREARPGTPWAAAPRGCATPGWG